MEFNSVFSKEKYGLQMRLVNENDAEFIVFIRTNSKLGRFIHSTSRDVDAQLQWIRTYKERELKGLDYYFMFEKEGQRLGVDRIYDITENTFTTGSWVFSPKAPNGSAILADIAMRELAFELYPDSLNLFDVKKENKNVIRYHRLFSPEVIRETNDTYYYSMSVVQFEKNKGQYLRMLLNK